MELRNKIKESGLKHWEIALALGISESTFTRWLRRELPERESTQIYAVIDKLIKSKEGIE